MIEKIYKKDIDIDYVYCKNFTKLNKDMSKTYL